MGAVAVNSVTTGASDLRVTRTYSYEVAATPDLGVLLSAAQARVDTCLTLHDSALRCGHPGFVRRSTILTAKQRLNPMIQRHEVRRSNVTPEFAWGSHSIPPRHRR